MIIRLGVIGLSVLIMQSCTNTPHHPHQVPVRVMGGTPQISQSVSPQKTTQSVRQASAYPVSRQSTSDPVHQPNFESAGQKNTVSVSPYEGQHRAQIVQQTERPHFTKTDSVRQTSQNNYPTPAPVTHTTSVTTHAPVPTERVAPVVAARTTNMSISDVIDGTIRNAPDLPIAKSGVIQNAPQQSSGSGQSIETVPTPASKGTGHQPSKQELAALGGEKPRFYWPVRGNVISSYGSKGSGKQNDGINITAPHGTAVKAAAAGLVVYSGEDLGGLGHLILIRHSGNYHTAYAHVDNKLVKTGDRVALGQAIANVGKTGNVTTPQLHFEIREGKKPVNPDGFLPRS
jgi:murein DD-endopeptidase MepM/ murein hydrolase activator NlpD